MVNYLDNLKSMVNTEVKIHITKDNCNVTQTYNCIPRKFNDIFNMFVIFISSYNVITRFLYK